MGLGSLRFIFCLHGLAQAFNGQTAIACNIGKSNLSKSKSFMSLSRSHSISQAQLKANHIKTSHEQLSAVGQQLVCQTGPSSPGRTCGHGRARRDQGLGITQCHLVAFQDIKAPLSYTDCKCPWESATIPKLAMVPRTKPAQLHSLGRGRCG